MTRSACEILHPHALRTRWVHDVRATYCDLCGCLFMPEPADPVSSARSSFPMPLRRALGKAPAGRPSAA